MPANAGASRAAPLGQLTGPPFGETTQTTAPTYLQIWRSHAATVLKRLSTGPGAVIEGAVRLAYNRCPAATSENNLRRKARRVLNGANGSTRLFHPKQ